MDKLIIANREIKSRLFIGTGKFGSNEVMKQALDKSGAEIITVAIRRIDLNNPDANLLNYIDSEKYLILPNTSGCRTTEEVMRIASIAKAGGLPNWIKLELTPEPHYLLPDPIETLVAAEKLVKAGFIVLPYINADPVLANRLQDIGTATVMPLASPIGSNQGLRTKEMLQIIIEQARVPVVIDAGLGKPSDATAAMELGADAVLVNTAIAIADDPIAMAEAFKKATDAGRQGYLAGLGIRKSHAEASSPLTGFL